MKTLPLSQLELSKKLVKPIKKAAPLVASIILATSAIVASAKQDKITNDNKEAVPAALALATFVPFATIKRKEGVEKTFNPDLYDAKMNVLLKRNWVNQYTYNIVRAICENDKIDVETAAKLVNWFNPNEKAVERLIMVVEANQIKNENLPNVFRAAEEISDKGMLERFLNDIEINNKPIRTTDLRDFILKDDENYDRAKHIYRLIEANGLEKDVSIVDTKMIAIQSKYIDNPHVYADSKLWGEVDNKALSLMPQFEAEGLIERLDDENLEKTKVELIRKYINDNSDISDVAKGFYAVWAHNYINSEETLEYFDILMKNADKFEKGVARVMDIITERHDPKKALAYFKGLITVTDGSLDDYLSMILSQR